MSDNPYPDGDGMKLNMGRNTMNYELHTAWDEGYAEGFAAGRAAATPDPPDDWTAAILTLRRAMCTPAGREQVERELIRPFAASPDERLREALTQIERLVAKWGAPIRHDVDDRVAYEKWAAVGSEAHKIAADALAAADREAPDEPYDPYTPAEEGLPDPGPCTDQAFIAPSSGPGVIEQSRVIERDDA